MHRGSSLSDSSAAGVALMRIPRRQYTFFGHLKWIPVLTLGYGVGILTHSMPGAVGKVNPELVNRTGILEINQSVRYYHLNTALGNRILDHYRRQGTELNPGFVGMLKLHHGMDY